MGEKVDKASHDLDEQSFFMAWKCFRRLCRIPGRVCRRVFFSIHSKISVDSTMRPTPIVARLPAACQPELGPMNWMPSSRSCLALRLGGGVGPHAFVHGGGGAMATSLGVGGEEEDA